MAMVIRYERPYSYSAHWARRLASFGLLVFLAAALSHRFGPLTTPHFLVFAGIGAALSLLAVVLALIGIVRLWQVGARGGKAAFAALILSALPLGVAGYAAQAYFSRPMIYDVTTDPFSSPPWLKVPVANQDFLARPAVTLRDREIQAAAYPELTGRRYEGALDRVLQGVRKVAEEQGIVFTEESGLENVIADLEDLAVKPDAAKPGTPSPDVDAPDAGESVITVVPVPSARPLEEGLLPRIGGPNDVLLQGQWRSLVFGFRFDIAIRLREEEETALVDMRVASRYGSHDLGLGAAFAERYLKALDAELLGIAGD